MAFSFGTPSSGSASSPFSFGTGTTSSSSTEFSFGSTTSSGSSASSGPSFSFGAASGTTPAFFFGGASSSAPSFSFGGSSSSSSTDLFGSSSGSGGFGFGGFGAPSSSGADKDGGSGGESIEAQFAAIERAYHPASPGCRFQFAFYNKVHPSLRAKYKPPENANKRLLSQAERNNPDPSTMVAVQAVGFQDLIKRLQEQDKAITEYQKKLEEEQRKLVDMKATHDLLTKVQVQELRKTQADLSHRLLKVMTQIDLLRARDVPLLNEEVDFRRKIDSIKRRLAKPAHFQARVSELSSIVRVQEDRPSDSSMLPLLDTENAKRIHEFLDTQRRCLAHLTTTVRKDINDMTALVQQLSDL